MTATLHIHLLGDFRLKYDGAPVTGVDTARPQSFLAYLLLHRDAAQSRSHLAYLFWPDSTESQALTNLRKQIYILRQTLPDADRFLEVDSKVVRWRTDAPFASDVSRFESALAEAEGSEQEDVQRAALERAIRLYRGDLLPSCYDDWILPERERLRQALARGTEQLLSLLEQQQDYGAAIRVAQRFLRHDSLHEGTYRRLMRLYALSGSRAEALRTYHTCASVLERELGVEPDPATRDLYERLVRLDDAEALVIRAKPRTLSSTLIGREEEWHRIQSAWQAAATGRPHLILLSGEVGIGTTRLAEEVHLWAARQGTATASARCYASDRGLAYGPVTAWLRSGPLQEALPDLDPVWLSEIARLLPELLTKDPDLLPSGPLTEGWQRQRLLQALVHAFSRHRQLVLHLDDVQWCDQETLEWLPHLLQPQPRQNASGSGPNQWLVVATVRTGETAAGGLLDSLLRALRREGQLTEIELGRLAEDEVASLATNVAGRPLDAGLVAELYRETEGNPLFVVETVQAGLPDAEEGQGALAQDRRGRRWHLPPVVQEAIAARLAQLSPTARELVNVAAVVGRAFTFEVLAPVSMAQAPGGGAGRPSEEELVCALDELWLRRIVREQGESAYDFSHDKIREVAYAGLSAVRRRFLHRCVAETLEKVYAGDLDSYRGLIAAHYEKAGLPEKAIASIGSPYAGQGG